MKTSLHAMSDDSHWGIVSTALGEVPMRWGIRLVCVAGLLAISQACALSPSSALEEPSSAREEQVAQRQLTVRLVDRGTGLGLAGISFSLEVAGAGSSMELTTDEAGEVSLAIPRETQRVHLDNTSQLLSAHQLQPSLGNSFHEVPEGQAPRLELAYLLPWAILDVQLDLPGDSELAQLGELEVFAGLQDPCYQLASTGMFSAQRALVFLQCPTTCAEARVVVQASHVDGSLWSPSTNVTVEPGWNATRLELQESPTLHVIVEGASDPRLCMWAEGGAWSESDMEPNPIQPESDNTVRRFTLHPPFGTDLDYVVSDGRTGWSVLAGSLQLEAGEQRELRLRSAAGDEPQLLAAGRVLDEQGLALAAQVVLLQLEDGGERAGYTDSAGSFRIYGRAGEQRGDLRVGPFSASLFPPVRGLGLPASDVILRRTRAAGTREVNYSIQVAQQDQPLEGASFSVFARDGEQRRWRLLAQSLQASGTLSIPFEPDLELAWAAEAFDFVCETGTLPAEPPPGSPYQLEVRLRPGFGVKYRIVDERTGCALAGAVARSPGGDVLGRADALGVLELSAARSIEEVFIEAPGYRASSLAPLVQYGWMAEIALIPELPSGLVE